MITKEVVEARWKLLAGGGLSVLFAIVVVATFELTRTMMGNPNLTNLPGVTPGGIAILSNFDTYIWSQWFARDGQLVLLIVAAMLGAGYVAGEVSKGTIYLLLSRPISRERALFTKYLSGAAALLVIAAIGTVAMYIATAVAGHPQNVAGMIISTLLMWLSAMFALGLATLFSTLFADVLRPLAVTLVILIAVGVPAVFNQPDWALSTYWSNVAAYLGQEFPMKELLVSLVAAILPLLIAVPLFRRQQY
jgi:ABC-2 type transport system permease protein